MIQHEDFILSKRRSKSQMLAGQVTMERPEEMVVTLAPYRCNSAWQVKICTGAAVPGK